MIHKERKIIETEKIDELEKASWFLRKYKNTNIILNKLFDIECELYRIENQHEKEVYLLDQLNELLLNFQSKHKCIGGAQKLKTLKY